MMGDLVENPVSKVVSGGSEAINGFLESGGLLKLFVWMGLVFLKVHLRDRRLRLQIDSRKGGGYIGDLHAWEDLHHLHCIVRCFYNDCEVDPEAIGSFLSLPVRRESSSNAFDFADFSFEQTMFLRLDDVGLIAVFNDSGASNTFFWQSLEKIKGAVSELQLREIMVELAFLNRHLKTRPVFWSELDLVKEKYRIWAKRPPRPELVDLDYTVRGELLRRAFGYALPNLQGVGYTREEILNAMESGAFTFLFDDDGGFIEKSLIAVRSDGGE